MLCDLIIFLFAGWPKVSSERESKENFCKKSITIYNTCSLQFPYEISCILAFFWFSPSHTYMNRLTLNKHGFICESITRWDELLSMFSKGLGKTRLNHGRAMWQGHKGVPDNTAALVLRAIPPLDPEAEHAGGTGDETGRGGEICWAQTNMQHLWRKD